jgi:hypothetical protein
VRAVIHLVVTAAVAATVQARNPGVSPAGAATRQAGARWLREISGRFRYRSFVALMQPMQFTNGGGDTVSLDASDALLRL